MLLNITGIKENSMAVLYQNCWWDQSEHDSQAV